MNYQEFADHTNLIVEKFKNDCKREVLLLHHNDADGLSSGAILKKAFERFNLKVSAYCLEKPYPKVLKIILQDQFLNSKTPVVFADFGSGMLPTIAELSQPDQQVFVLDHHLVEATTAKNIHILNPLDFGFNGSTEVTASTVCYFFAKSLGEYNTDLAKLALIGIIGDRQSNAEGLVQGLNQSVLQDLKTGDLTGQQMTVAVYQELKKTADAVDALGSFAYFRKGPDIALKGLQEEFSAGYFAQAQIFANEFEQYYSEFLKNCKIQETDHLQYFFLDQKAKNFGVKTVGLLASRFALESRCNPNKYILGFQEIPDQIPGLGPVTFNDYKVSMRLPAKIAEKVKNKTMPDLTQILPAAAKRINGFVDACHKHAAAATIEIGREAELVEGLGILIISLAKL